MSARVGSGPVGIALGLACAGLLGCVPRSDEEIWGDVPFASDRTCLVDAACDDGNPCTRDVCLYDGESFTELCRYEAPAGLVPDDNDPCTEDLCVQAWEVHRPMPAGAPCGAGGALACDEQGVCVGCGGDADACGPETECLSWACEADACVLAPQGYGKLLVEQQDGDCAVLVCDGRGGVELAWEVTDGPVTPAA